MLPNMKFGSRDSRRALGCFVRAHNELAHTRLPEPAPRASLLDWATAHYDPPRLSLMDTWPDGHFTFRLERKGGHRFIFAHTRERELKLTLCRFDPVPQHGHTSAVYAQLLHELLLIPRIH